MEFYTPEQDKDGLKSPQDAKAGLPNVFLIGDSISGGYTKPVTALLKGVANVQRANANCGDTIRGLNDLDEWLGDTRWDLIHFNWGLHDLCYRHPDSKVYGNRDKTKGTIAVEPGQYGKNLEVLVQRLKSRHAQLVWANTTFMPPDEVGRFQGDDVRYNEIAAEIMKSHGIPINDLHTLTASFGPDMFTCPGDVHFSEQGYARIAEQVADFIRTQLTSEEQPT